MKHIKILPEGLIDRIAAGEVIENPASIVKELVENSLDASAENVEISTAGGGKEEILIVDDGDGIPKGQIEIAFMRHATSKIKNWNDLLKTLSFGFRGEALPSIASVSITEFTSCYLKENVGSKIRIEGGKQVYFGPAPPIKGSVFSVKNLFYNVPARRKFLKSDSSEQRRISEVIRRYTISRPDVGFKITRENKQIGMFNSTSDLLKRLSDVWGSKLTKDLLRIEPEPTGPVNVYGYISNPETTRGNRSEIYFYVNKRPVLEKAMYGAVTAAYSQKTGPGRFPYIALFLDIEPNFLDINVHPAKTEVRFSDEGFIFSTIRNALIKTLSIPVTIPVNASSLQQTKGGAITFEEAKRELFSNIASGNSENHSVDLSTLEKPLSEQGKIESGPIENAQIMQIFDTFFIVRDSNGLVIVDQHTAHERILFEKTLKAFSEQKIPSQQLLFEERVKLSPEESLLVEKLSDHLSSAGFDIRQFGGDDIIISGMPPEFSQLSPAEALKKLLNSFSAFRREGHELKYALAAAVACRGAVKAGQRLSDPLMKGLYSELLKCDEPYRCPHGRPTIAVLNQNDLEKIFKRK